MNETTKIPEEVEWVKRMDKLVPHLDVYADDDFSTRYREAKEKYPEYFQSENDLINPNQVKTAESMEQEEILKSPRQIAEEILSKKMKKEDIITELNRQFRRAYIAGKHSDKNAFPTADSYIDYINRYKKEKNL